MSFFEQSFDHFVIYALPDDRTEPDEQSPSLVLEPLYDGERNILWSDKAPYVTVLDHVDLEDEIASAQENNELTDSQRDALDSLRRFMKRVRGDGLSWFAYQLEPGAIAGNGTARRRGLDAGG